MRWSTPTRLLILATVAAATPWVARAATQAGASTIAESARAMTLAQCIDEAMQNSRRRHVSQFAVAMAEAQHRQALAGYWPQVGVRGVYQHFAAYPDFLFPASQMSLPAGTATVSIPAGVVAPVPVQLPVSTPPQTIDVPAQHVKLLNPDLFSVSVGATWLLYDGGMRQGLGEQTDGLVAMMKAEARRTDLELVDDVTRLYHGALLARQLVQLGSATLQRLVVTLELTERLYQGGSASVTRTDWLGNKAMVETVRGMVAELEKNQAMAEAALATTLGLPWSASVRPVDEEIPFAPFHGDLAELVDGAYRTNPDWEKVQGALRAARGTLRTARSEWFPKLVVNGEAVRRWNNYEAGLATDHNTATWSAGAVVDLPLFTGFSTAGKVDEAEARTAQLEAQQALLRDGLGLRLRDAYLGLAAAGKTYAASREARDAAVENRELTTRAYEAGAVETEKVIRAQLEEALLSAQHLKARYDHAAARSHLRLLVGAELGATP